MTLSYGTSISEGAAASRGDLAWNASTVIFAPGWMVKQAQLPKAATNAIVVTHHAESDGLLAGQEGRRLVPIDRAAGAVALWVWTGEFVAACTGLMAQRPARANAMILFNPVIDTASADGCRPVCGGGS